jgi:lipopolysaccharide biosynthesis regulator YciM
MLGRLDESARAFDKAYYIDVHEVRSGIVRGMSLLKGGKFDEAIRSLSEVLGIMLR